jgi:hypothetical protein
VKQLRSITLKVDESFGPDYAGEYEFIAISWKKYTDIMNQCARRDPLTRQPTDMDDAKLNNMLLLASLKRQPEKNPVTMETLTRDDGLPTLLVQRFIKCTLTLNVLGAQEANQLTLGVLRKKPTEEGIIAFLAFQLGKLPSEVESEDVKKIQELITYWNAANKE